MPCARHSNDRMGEVTKKSKTRWSERALGSAIEDIAHFSFDKFQAPCNLHIVGENRRILTKVKRVSPRTLILFHRWCTHKQVFHSANNNWMFISFSYSNLLPPAAREYQSRG